MITKDAELAMRQEAADEDVKYYGTSEQKLALAKRTWAKKGSVALTAAEWKKTHKDFKGYAELDGHPMVLHLNPTNGGTELWPVVIVNADGTDATRQPRGKVKKA